MVINFHTESTAYRHSKSAWYQLIAPRGCCCNLKGIKFKIIYLLKSEAVQMLLPSSKCQSISLVNQHCQVIIVLCLSEIMFFNYHMDQCVNAMPVTMTLWPQYPSKLCMRSMFTNTPFLVTIPEICPFSFMFRWTCPHFDLPIWYYSQAS